MKPFGCLASDAYTVIKRWGALLTKISCQQQIPSPTSLDPDLKSLNQVSATCEHHYGGPSVTNDLFAHLFVDASFLIEILFAIC